MEIKEFLDFFEEQVLLEAVANDVTPSEAFLGAFTEILKDAEEFEEFIYLPFEGTGKYRQKIQIDGYTYDELDESLILFVLAALDGNTSDTLTATEAVKYFDKALAFIENADYIKANFEESSPAFGLANDVLKMYKNVKSYRIYLFTDKTMSKQIRNFNNKLLNDKIVEFHLWDMSRLHDIAESGNLKEDVIIDFKEFDGLGIPCLLANNNEDYTSYLCNMPGKILADIYNKYGSRLLEGNVRSFLQTKGKVNKGIRNSILNTPKMFFAYNNGIAATSSEVCVENINGQNYITKLTALQIVNGGQTTASIASAYLNDKKEGVEEKIEHIRVPMKLSVVDHEKAREIIPRISEYANTQNKVSQSDLRSNHPFQIRLELASRRITAPAIQGQQYGTKWFYERANGQYSQETYKSNASDRKKFELYNPKSQLFKKTDLAKYMNIYSELPHIASAGGEKSFIKFHEEMNRQWEIDDEFFNDEYFKKVVALAIIIKETDRIIKTQDWFKGSYKANIVAYTVSKIKSMIEHKNSERVLPYHKIWELQTIPKGMIGQIKIVSEKVYDILTDPTRSIENVTEWAKREECWKRVKLSDVQITSEFFDTLEYLNDQLEGQKSAKKDQREINDINYLVLVAEFGLDMWKDLYKWGTERKLLGPFDLDLIKVAFKMSTGHFPSDKQCKALVRILNNMREEGYPN